MRVGIMATYPPRAGTLRFTLTSLRSQLDKLVVVANEYESIPDFLRLANVEVVLPDANLMDTGKFATRAYGDGDAVFLVDDDIIYPPNYVSRLVQLSNEIPLDAHIVGVHGVIYSDFFDGDVASRAVYGFEHAVIRSCVVNQLGTGTVMIRGDRMPPFSVMQSAKGFVDVRFARYCFERGLPLICVERPAGWLRGVRTSESLFKTVTKRHAEDDSILREITTFGGFARLPDAAVAAVEGRE